MTIIYKYPLALERLQVIKTPRVYDFLSVQFQGDTLCLWAEVQLEEELIETTIEINGTGYPLSDDESFIRNFIGTVQHDGFVWHVYWRDV